MRSSVRFTVLNAALAMACAVPAGAQAPGIIAEKYGPHTPGTNTGSRVVVIVHEEVPNT